MKHRRVCHIPCAQKDLNEGQFKTSLQVGRRGSRSACQESAVGCISTRPLSVLVHKRLPTKLLTPTPPAPPQPPPKSDIQFQGTEASESKNPLGDRFIGQNNDFYKG